MRDIIKQTLTRMAEEERDAKKAQPEDGRDDTSTPAGDADPSGSNRAPAPDYAGPSTSRQGQEEQVDEETDVTQDPDDDIPSWHLEALERLQEKHAKQVSQKTGVQSSDEEGHDRQELYDVTQDFNRDFLYGLLTSRRGLDLRGADARLV